MPNRRRLKFSRQWLLAATMLAGVVPFAAWADMDDKAFHGDDQQLLPTGQFITPKAPAGAAFIPLNAGLASHPKFVANGAIQTAVSPDGKTLLVMTSGYNLEANAAQTATDSGSQFIFVYDITGTNARTPIQKQIIAVNDTYAGLVWAPAGDKFYVSGGHDDKVWVYTGSTAAGWTAATSIPMGHASFATGPFAGFASFISNGIGFLEDSSVAGLGISADGSVLVAVNSYNDSITVIDTATNTKRFEYDLRPFNTSGTAGVAGGETPFGVAVKGNAVVYVSSIRDREVVAVNIAGTSPGLMTRIALPGNPNNLILSADQTRLYVAQENSDTVAVIDTTSNAVLEEISTIAPPGIVPAGTKYTGANANNLTLSADGHTLFVTNGGANSVAIVPLTGPTPHLVSGLVPTAWYPTAVSLGPNGDTMYVANYKSVPGKNPDYTTSNANNEYVLQLEGGGLQVLRVPHAEDLEHLTAQVAANNSYKARDHDDDADEMMDFLHQRIKHIIYIVKENRTFDQVLGDLPNGANGDPELASFGKQITPNFHRISQSFVTLDNFFCSGEVSGNGWAWSTEARESDYGTKTIFLNYAGRGGSYDEEGTNRNVNVGLATVAEWNSQTAGNIYGTLASAFPGGVANLLPGTNNDAATDGPNGLKQAGYIWDAALRAGLTVRNYGFYLDLSRYSLPKSFGGLQPVDYAASNYLRDPSALNLTVAFPANSALAPVTDPFFRGFDNAFPDVWRVEEWQREFNQYVTAKNLPNLTLLRLMHDHMGNFGGSDTAVAGLTTPETQQADNDLAVGRVIETVAHSPYADSTLIVVIEDDSQDGPDHVDAHRGTAYIVGPYVKHNRVVSTRYSTVNLVRTIEDILGLEHLNLNDAYQRPMSDVFDRDQSNWTYSAVASTVLKTTSIALGDSTVRYAEGPDIVPKQSPMYWAEATKGFDWTAADRVPADLYNEVLWEGLNPGVRYPYQRSGADLRRRLITDSATAATKD